MIRHTVTALAAAGVLLAGACSNGDGSKPAAASESGAKAATSSEQFCASAQALYDQLENAGASDPSSPPVQAVFAEARDLAAPDEIASDWTEVLDSIEPLVSGEVDLNDPAAMATMTDRAAEAADAFQRTGTYFEEECGFGPTATTTTTTP